MRAEARGGAPMPSVRAAMAPMAPTSPRSRESSLPAAKNLLSPRDIYIQKALEQFRKMAPLQREFPLFGEITVNNEQALDTAYHEVDHGLLVYAQGGTVTQMTVIPGPGYLGLTEFAGLDVRQTQVAAMASSVLHGGGTGGDVALARYLEPVGMSLASAEGVARSELNRIPSFMRGRIAQMVAWFGTVNGSQFSEIMARAAIDAQYMGKITPQELENYLQKSAEHLFEAEFIEKTQPARTRIIDIDKHQSKVVTIEGKKQCPNCGLPFVGMHECTKSAKAEIRESEETDESSEKHPTRRSVFVVPGKDTLVD